MIMLTLATILLLGSSLGAAGRLSSPSARSPTSSFTDSEMQCFADEKVLYTDGKCYTLRQKGPCLEGQWLVFAEAEGGRSNTLRLACKARPCTTAARPIYWPEDGQCHKMADKKTLCPRRGNELRSNSYGDGECACSKTFARFEPEVLRGRNTTAEWEGDCYPLYRRGPCPARKVLVPGILDGFGLVGKCGEDLCARQNAAEPTASYVLHRVDNTCYRLATTGPPPCRPDESFNIHPMTNQPGCIGRVNSVFSGYGGRCDGRGGINTLTGECREQVFFKAQTFGLEVSRRKRERRRSRLNK